MAISDFMHLPLPAPFNIMIMQVPNTLSVALVSQAFLTFASAAVEVSTSRVAWEARVASVTPPLCIHIDDFSGPAIELGVGTTELGLFNVFINNLSIGPLGQLNGIFQGIMADFGPTILDINNFADAPVIGFAGDWAGTMTSALLQVTINGVLFKFDDYLTFGGGTGFLGFVDEFQSINNLEFTDANPTPTVGEFLTLDNAKAAGWCSVYPPAGCQGDPHFKTWRGQHYDYHGECDLVLLHSSAFESGLVMDVHIRKRSDVTCRTFIGSDVLEVESKGVSYLNGVAGAALPDEFSGFAFSHTQPTNKQHVFEVHLGGRERIKLKTYKDLVSVLIEQGHNEHFSDSVGLMGAFRYGVKLSRDGEPSLTT